jgi:hypothetical protein
MTDPQRCFIDFGRSVSIALLIVCLRPNAVAHNSPRCDYPREKPMEDRILQPRLPKLEGVVNRTLEGKRVPGAACRLLTHGLHHQYVSGLDFD